MSALAIRRPERPGWPDMEEISRAGFFASQPTPYREAQAIYREAQAMSQGTTSVVPLKLRRRRFLAAAGRGAARNERSRYSIPQRPQPHVRERIGDFALVDETAL
jgi:hypothetical protein